MKSEHNEEVAKWLKANIEKHGWQTHKIAQLYAEHYHTQQSKANSTEAEILKATKEFAEANDIHYDDMTESMILNAMREVKQSPTISDEVIGYNAERECKLIRDEYGFMKGAKWYRDKVAVASTEAEEKPKEDKAKQILIDILAQEEEIISSPIRFNGVHIEKIRKVFAKFGIRHDIDF